MKAENLDPTPSVVEQNTLASPQPRPSLKKIQEEELSEILSSQLLSKVDERSSVHVSRELVTLPNDLFQRLVKLKLLDEIDRSQQALLTKKETEMFYNAQLFMRYLIVLRRLMVSLHLISTTLTGICRKLKLTKTSTSTRSEPRLFLTEVKRLND